MQIRNALFFIFGLLMFSLLACSAKSNPVALVEPEVSFTDSLDHRGRHMRLYGNDSIYYYWSKIDDSVRRLDMVRYIADTIVGNVRNKIFSSFGHLEKIIYHVDTTDGAMHFKSFYDNGKLSEIAYLRDTLFFDTLGIYRELGADYMGVDLVEKYLQDGTLGRKGYVGYFSEDGYLNGQYDCLGVWKSYNSQGILTEIESPMPGGTLQEYFHANGKLERRLEMVEMYGGSHCKAYQDYDSLGHKVRDVSNVLLYTDGANYHDVFVVATTKEYYRNGKVKLLKINKSFSESDQCPCGKWIYYDKSGRVVKTEKYGDCYSLELDCY